MTGRKWSDEEEECLRKYYPDHGSTWEGWAGLLDGRTSCAIKQRARHLKIHSNQYNRWSPYEDAMLMENYKHHGSRWSGWRELLPDRSRDSIASRARYLGILTGTHKYPWDNSQRKELLIAYGHMMSHCDHTFDECIREIRRLKSRAMYKDKVGGEK